MEGLWEQGFKVKIKFIKVGQDKKRMLLKKYGRWIRKSGKEKVENLCLTLILLHKKVFLLEPMCMGWVTSLKESLLHYLMIEL